MRAFRPSQNSFIYLVLPWIVFSTLYWVAAYFKPFHVDEYFSWVYAERCSFWEIITLKDTGIGHPPLFHLLQKIVQTCFPVYHPLQVRLVNYLAGSAFIIILTKVLRREHSVPGFFLGMASSACVLNTFVFGRMWGLVCLASLLLLWSGENYARERTRGNAVLFIVTAIFGFVSDYSFVLLIPYVIIIIFSNSKHSETIKRLGFWATVSACLLSASTLGFTKGWGYSLYFLVKSISKLPFETANLLLNFWFIETFILSIAVLAFVYYLCWYKPCRQDGARWGSRENILAVGILLVIIRALFRYLSPGGIDAEPAVTTSIILFSGPAVTALIILFYCRTKRAGVFVFSDDKNRLFLALITGMLLLLTLNPFSWRDLANERFLVVLLPFMLVLIYTTFQRTVLLTFSVLLSVSGLLYITSNGIADWFPPKSLEAPQPTVYESVLAYSDRYLHSDKVHGTGPYFIDMREFDHFCRVCKMGIDRIPYDGLDSLTVLAWSDWKPIAIPSEFVCSGQNAYGLSWTDRFQFRYFSPIYPRHFSTFQCERDAK